MAEDKNLRDTFFDLEKAFPALPLGRRRRRSGTCPFGTVSLQAAFTHALAQWSQIPCLRPERQGGDGGMGRGCQRPPWAEVHTAG